MIWDQGLLLGVHSMVSSGLWSLSLSLPSRTFTGGTFNLSVPSLSVGVGALLPKAPG